MYINDVAPKNDEDKPDLIKKIDEVSDTLNKSFADMEQATKRNWNIFTNKIKDIFEPKNEESKYVSIVFI